ncbi:M23 family metallopeptidase [Microbacterium sp. zg.B48]|uniref:murein hydrolase activator EnvC family protein n=1 Tax=Microbacterium sp. zg.B48 TaxID=2969408 RepID=UPI00214CFBE6|nr:M23 family metallopeptidase [Microbacterium sp. zg.B48]MCR2763687.1 M23 family metallopeptidase [Microbacterium sp. zg.B48]
MAPARPSGARGPGRATVAWGIGAALILSATVVVSTPAADAAVTPVAPAADLSGLGWVWPSERFRLVRPFVAPAHEYAPGHRGIDLDPASGGVVRAPADGVVAFSGAVAGRGILTIDHGAGLVTTLEPVESTLAPGTSVRGGEEVAMLAAGGHASPGTLHFGVRLDGEYINPLLLLGGVPRAVLLPCCA